MRWKSVLGSQIKSKLFDVIWLFDEKKKKRIPESMRSHVTFNTYNTYNVPLLLLSSYVSSINARGLAHLDYMFEHNNTR